MKRYMVVVEVDGEVLEFEFSPLESESDHMSAAVEHAARLAGAPPEEVGQPALAPIRNERD